MKDNEQKHERSNDENKAPNRIEVQNMILEAKFDIAKSKITFLLTLFSILLALFAVLGIIVPLSLSNSQESRVNNAITNMENSFKELAGKQLRKPKIICRGDKDELLQGSIFEVSGTYSRTNINICNEGDGLAKPVKAYVYFKDEKKILKEGQFGDWEMQRCEDENYSIKFLIGECDYISPYDFFPIPTSCNYFPSDSNGYETNALLKVYYGEPEPISVKFTFRLKR